MNGQQQQPDLSIERSQKESAAIAAAAAAAAIAPPPLVPPPPQIGLSVQFWLWNVASDYLHKNKSAAGSEELWGWVNQFSQHMVEVIRYLRWVEADPCETLAAIVWVNDQYEKIGGGHPGSLCCSPYPWRNDIGDLQKRCPQ
jgi:hypothetical protein